MYDFLYYKTKLPSKVIESIDEYLEDTIPKDLKEGSVGIDNTNNKQIRSSKINFIDANCWIGGFIYYYIIQANISNYNYDIFGYHENSIQYSEYSKNSFYDWHIDYQGGGNVNTLVDRKLSFSLQLSDSIDYEGGDLQLMDSCTNKTYFAPREKGSIVIFDSKIKHRVKKINSGCRKSLVGWICGPKFR